MKKYLTKIHEIISHELKGSISTYQKLDSWFVMNDKASEIEIAHCDSAFGNRIPSDYKDFLGNFNGGILFKVKDFAGFQFLGTKDLARENEYQREQFGSDWDERIILFCELLGNAEYLGFKLDEKSGYEIVFCIMDESPSKWEAIGTSFETFMDILIKEGGREFWLWL
jgi:hypothetical protein